MPILSPQPGPALHLVSDLDGTWLPGPGQGAGLARLEAFLAERPEIVLTFATGRTLESALEVLAGRVGRLPRHLVTDVGTALHHRTPGGGWREDRDYAAWAASRWPEDLPERLAGAGYPEGVRLQPDARPCRRLALELAPGAPPEPAVARLRATLDRLGLRAEVLASHGRYLDVLPPGVDKGAAVRHLGLGLPVVACGDSENDLSLWRIADLAVLMADSALDPRRTGVPPDRLVQPRTPGPEGILDVLRTVCREGTLRP